MNNYEESIKVMTELFSKDYTFVLATTTNNIPSARVIDTYYADGVFWIVTYANSNKVKDILDNSNVALCNDFYTFRGSAYNMGHPLKTENKEIREMLIQVFEPWYFAHNNEEDENMCFVKMVPESGFFHKDGTGYRVNFLKKEADKIPFDPK